MDALLETYEEMKKASAVKIADSKKTSTTEPKVFKHTPAKLSKLQRVDVKGLRYYVIPGTVYEGLDNTFIQDANSKFVSITTVIGHNTKHIFTNWRKRVGDAAADKKIKHSTGRGTDTHTLIEHYLNNEPLPHTIPEDSLPYELFKKGKSTLDRIDNIHCLEGPLYSEFLEIAGTTDCIAEYEGELAVIDFKTSEKKKPRDWIDSYFIQAAAYACMYYELTGIRVKKFVIIMMCENGATVVYEERDKGKYIKLLDQYIKKFLKDKIAEYQIT